jgi:nicotinamidase-related amidase
MRIKACESVLLVVDIQERLLPAIDGGEAVLANAGWLADAATLIGVPTIVSEQYPRGIGPTEADLRRRLAGAAIVEKIHFSAVSEGRLFAAPGGDRRQWVVAGTEAHVCVLQTVLDLLAAGREVYIVDDATGSRRARDKALALERMRQEGARIVSREMVVFEWLERADTARFREALARFLR